MFWSVGTRLGSSSCQNLSGLPYRPPLSVLATLVNNGLLFQRMSFRCSSSAEKSLLQRAGGNCSSPRPERNHMWLVFFWSSRVLETQQERVLIRRGRGAASCPSNEAPPAPRPQTNTPVCSAFLQLGRGGDPPPPPDGAFPGVRRETADKARLWRGHVTSL